MNKYEGFYFKMRLLSWSQAAESCHPDGSSSLHFRHWLEFLSHTLLHTLRKPHQAPTAGRKYGPTHCCREKERVKPTWILGVWEWRSPGCISAKEQLHSLSGSTTAAHRATAAARLPAPPPPPNAHHRQTAGDLQPAENEPTEAPIGSEGGGSHGFMSIYFYSIQFFSVLFNVPIPNIVTTRHFIHLKKKKRDSENFADVCVVSGAKNWFIICEAYTKIQLNNAYAPFAFGYWPGSTLL